MAASARMRHLSEVALIVVVAYAVVVSYTRMEAAHATQPTVIARNTQTPAHIAPARLPFPGATTPLQNVLAANAPGASTANPIPGIPTPEVWLRQWQAHHHNAGQYTPDSRLCYDLLRSSDPAIRSEAAATCPRGDR